jgi:transposase
MPSAASQMAEPLFSPVELEPPHPARSKSLRRKSRHGCDGGIEVEIDCVTIRLGRGAETKTIAAIIRALRRSGPITRPTTTTARPTKGTRR